MEFTYVCVCIVVIGLTALVSLLAGAIVEIAVGLDDFVFGPWLISVIVLGAMITWRLVELGIV